MKITIRAILVLTILSLSILSYAEDSNSEIKQSELVMDELGTIRGLIKPRTTAIISSEISAQIEKFPYKAGDSFKKGERLVKFDCSLYYAQLAAAKAELEASKKNLENQQRLLALNATSNIEVDLAAIEVKRNNANVNVSAVPVSRCSIKAPYSGRVIETMVNQYESVAKDQELLSILNDDVLEIEVIVPSKWLTWLEPGITFLFNVDETGVTYKAKVNKISSVVDPVSQTIPIIGVFEEKVDVLAGMSGTARFEKVK